MICTHRELDDLRHTLQTLKAEGAFEGHVRLAFAADKTLRAIGQELQAYDDFRTQILNDYAKRDDDDRKIWKFRATKVVRSEDGEHFVDLQGDTVATVQEVNANADELQHVIADPADYQSDMQDVAGEKVSVELHQVEEDLFFEYANLEGVHDRVDLSTLAPMLK